MSHQSKYIKKKERSCCRDICTRVLDIFISAIFFTFIFYAFSLICFALLLRSEASECGSGRGVNAEAAGSRAGERGVEETAGGAAGPAGGQGFHFESRHRL